MDDTEKALRASRPATPQKAANVTFSQSPSPRKPAFVLADWKHRVPEPELPGPKPAAGSLNGHARAKAVEERKRQLSAEYACVYNTINSVLSRCKQVQQRLGSSSPPATGSHHSPTYLSVRSKLLFEAPQLPHTPEHHGARASVDQTAAMGAKPRAVAAAAVQQQSWGGAVDLNPGFSFLPGTPQRLAATCPDELPLVLARFAGLIDDVRHMDLSSLRHREVLQAGVQQLNGEFYTALRQAAVKQHRHQQLPGVIPPSWDRA